MRRMWTRAGALCVLALGISGLTAGGAAAQGQEDFSERVLASGFENPWEVTYGPDGKLWVSEQDAGRVSRVDPESGRKTTLLRVRDLYLTDDPSAQDGMVGLALSPSVGKAAKGHVYVAYAYDADPDPDQLLRRVKIRRYTYARGASRLTEPKNLITGMPASNDHNSGRLVLGPDRKLYYTIGDQGNNQFDNFCTPIRSQDLPTAKQVADRDWQTYQGKVLRLNTDGSIPADNPTFGGVRSHVFSYGHRNAQGIVFGPGGAAVLGRARPEVRRRAEHHPRGRQLRLAARARLPGRPGLHLRQLVALGRRALPGPDVRQLRGPAVRSPAEGERVEQPGLRRTDPDLLHRALRPPVRRPPLR